MALSNSLPELRYLRTLVDAEVAITSMLAEHPTRVGMDVEAVNEDLCMVQICDGKVAYLLHVALMNGMLREFTHYEETHSAWNCFQGECPRALRTLLEANGIAKAGVNIFGELNPAFLYELRVTLPTNHS